MNTVGPVQVLSYKIVDIETGLEVNCEIIIIIIII